MEKTVKTRDWRTIVVDTSDEACGKFGFKHGDRISTSSGKKGTVMGVAPATECDDLGQETLWLALDRDNGRVSYCIPFKGNVFPE